MKMTRETIFLWQTEINRERMRALPVLRENKYCMN